MSVNVIRATFVVCVLMAKCYIFDSVFACTNRRVINSFSIVLYSDMRSVFVVRTVADLEVYPSLPQFNCHISLPCLSVNKWTCIGIELWLALGDKWESLGCIASRLFFRILNMGCEPNLRGSPSFTSLPSSVTVGGVVPKLGGVRGVKISLILGCSSWCPMQTRLPIRLINFWKTLMLLEMPYLFIRFHVIPFCWGKKVAGIRNPNCGRCVYCLWWNDHPASRALWNYTIFQLNNLLNFLIYLFNLNRLLFFKFFSINLPQELILVKF